MACCGKTIKKVKNIATGYKNLAVGKKFVFTDSRIRICQKCDKNYWLGKTLWCSLCWCFIPAKARVPDEKCPLGKWAEIDEKAARIGLEAKAG